ncbi:hypothetical protein J2S09_004103 [Bacillus fengqiuensis]|nr:hypothetical protein [Bacillus fengqiuensis]
MTRFINPSRLKKLSDKNSCKIGVPVVGVKAIATVNGKEKVGEVVYKRKAIYGKPFED